jgi:hypothetical protein
VKTCAVDVNTSRTPEEGAHIPSWPNGLVIIIVRGNKADAVCSGTLNVASFQLAYGVQRYT